MDFEEFAESGAWACDLRQQLSARRSEGGRTANGFPPYFKFFIQRDSQYCDSIAFRVEASSPEDSLAEKCTTGPPYAKASLDGVNQGARLQM